MASIPTTSTLSCAVITTLNEDKSIGQLVYELIAYHSMPVIVIDDASTDNTATVARAAGAAVYVNRERIGIGPSLVRGWRFALDSWADRIIQIDAGGSHDPNDIPKILKALQDNDMVIGSRFLPESSYIDNGNWKRPILSRIAAKACNLAQHGAKHTDWTSGYRGFRADLLRALVGQKYQAKMHGWQIEVLARANELCADIAEVPITYTAGRSSFNRDVADEAFRTWLHVINHIGPRPDVKGFEIW